MGEACSTSGKKREMHTKSRWGRRPLSRPRRRWENNTHMDLKEIMCEVAESDSAKGGEFLYKLNDC